MKQNGHKSRYAFSFSYQVFMYLIFGIFIIIGRIIIPIKQQVFRSEGAQYVLLP